MIRSEAAFILFSPKNAGCGARNSEAPHGTPRKFPRSCGTVLCGYELSSAHGELLFVKYYAWSNVHSQLALLKLVKVSHEGPWLAPGRFCAPPKAKNGKIRGKPPNPGGGRLRCLSQAR